MRIQSLLFDAWYGLIYFVAGLWALADSERINAADNHVDSYLEAYLRFDEIRESERRAATERMRERDEVDLVYELFELKGAGRG